MAATLALLTDTIGGVVMAKVRLGKLTGSLVEGILIVDALIMVVPGGVEGVSFGCLGKGHLFDLIGLTFDSRFHFGLEARFGS